MQRMTICKQLFITSSLIFSIANLAIANDGTAPITGFANVFLFDKPVPNATITILETGQKIKTDEKGKFGPFQYPIGKPLTLELNKWGYKTIQSGTVIVPPEGLTGPYDNITFQVPNIETYYLLTAIIGADLKKEMCHVVTTVTAYHKTLDDIPQGIADAKITISPFVPADTFYFDIFKDGPLKNKTNPFTKGLTQTTLDGGVGYFNLPPSEQPYTISAEKSGVSFTSAQFICRKGAFINISPPRGPMALTEG